MRLDLEKLKVLEKKYEGNPVTLNTLTNSVNMVLSGDYAGLHYDTLLELGVIREDDGNKNANTQQINS